MSSTSTPFFVTELVSSVSDIIAGHSSLTGPLLTIHIDEQVPKQVLGDSEKIRRALIITIERSLIQRPNLPITISCAMVRQDSDDATLSFSIMQRIGETNTAHTPHFRDAAPDTEHAEIPEELSLKIAKRVIDECGGKMFIQPAHQYPHEICFWIPVGLQTGLQTTAIPCHCAHAIESRHRDAKPS